ncbi:MAG: PRC and DUF2382 domain-containing protein, partial [Deinococcus sp.]
GNQRIGTVRDVLVDDDYSKIRYLIVDTDVDSGSGAVVVPVGMARIDGNGVYFEGVSAAQLGQMHRYSEDEEYTFDAQSSDERVLRGADSGVSSGGEERVLHAADTASTGTPQTGRYNYRDEDSSDRMFKSPQQLQLLEERLSVAKDRYVAGSVEVGKWVETRTENVNVDLQREEVVIERRPVTDSRPVDGNMQLGADSQTIRVDLEAERADVSKQAFVTEEVEIGKRTETERKTVTETVGREVLDVTRNGEVEVSGDDDLQNKRRQ